MAVGSALAVEAHAVYGDVDLAPAEFVADEAAPTVAWRAGATVAGRDRVAVERGGGEAHRLRHVSHVVEAMASADKPVRWRRVELARAHRRASGRTQLGT